MTACWPRWTAETDCSHRTPPRSLTFPRETSPLAELAHVESALKVELENARRLREDLFSERLLILQHELERALVHTLDSVRAVRRHIDADLRRYGNFASGLQRALDTIHEALHSATIDAQCSDFASASPRDLKDALTNTNEVAAFLRSVSAPATIAHAGLDRKDTNREYLQQNQVRIASSAERVVAIAARSLPVRDRGRYTEEFRGELWDLAEASASQIQQVAYAIRVFVRMKRLRHELESPRRASR